MASFRSLAFLFVAAALLGATIFTSRPSAAAVETVRLVQGEVISIRTPEFVQTGKRYAFTGAGGGPAQTYTVKARRQDGWILVEVADENTNPAYFVPGDWPTRWLNIGTAISIQEMRPHQ
jgi:hypothetical protein